MPRSKHSHLHRCSQNATFQTIKYTAEKNTLSLSGSSNDGVKATKLLAAKALLYSFQVLFGLSRVLLVDLSSNLRYLTKKEEAEFLQWAYGRPAYKRDSLLMI